MLTLQRIEWYERNKERLRADARRRSVVYRSRPGYRTEDNLRHIEYVKRLRMKVFTLLGNQCRICSIDDIRVLQLDHINNDGCKERKQLKLRAHQLYNKVLNNSSGYQVLCANCNWRKRKDNLIRSEETFIFRLRAIQKYGGKCIRCGELDHEVLHFDHINDDGDVNRRHRNMVQRYKEYLADKHDVQILCCNCHQIKTFYEGVIYAGV